jgi:hypothetical protein
MKMKQTLVKIAFSDFYGQSYSPREYKGPQYSQTVTPNENYVYVHDCVFSYCSSSSNGGALNCGNSVYKLLVEQTTFISCSTSDSYGGGIYFYSTTNGECVLSRICGFDCSSTGSGIFAYINTKDDAAFKNHVYDSSFTHTLIKSGRPQRILYLTKGNVLCPSVNITNNECYYYPAFGFYPTISSVSDTCCISCSSIVNNTANGGWGCILFDGSTTSQRMDTCNIINNKQTIYSSYELTIWSSSNLLIKDSCILGNNAGKKVFYVSSGKVTISNCTIDDDIISNARYSGSVSFTKMIERSFIHALSHISTQKCDSYFDSYGTLTAKPPGSPQRTKDRCFGCFTQCNIKNPTIDPFIIMELLFILTVIPSDPSNDYYFDSNCYLQLSFVNN